MITLAEAAFGTHMEADGYNLFVAIFFPKLFHEFRHRMRRRRGEKFLCYIFECEEEQMQEKKKCEKRQVKMLLNGFS